jgi:hypothetical protein
MVRLRYFKNEDTGNFTSKEIIAGSISVTITLNPKFNTFSVVNTQTGEVVAQGSGKTFSKLKIAAKEAVKGLGVVFADEIRNRPSRVNVEEL